MGRRRSAKYEDPGRIENVGVENLRGMSEYDPTERRKEYGNMDRPNYAPEEYYSDENHYWNFITFDNIKNGWVRNVHGASLRLQHGGDTARGKMDHGAGLRLARADLAAQGARRFTFALRGQLDAGAALPLRQGPPLVHDRPAHGERQRIPGLRGDPPVLIERTARAVGHGRPLRQCPRATDSPVLEGHQYRMGAAPTPCSGTARGTSSFRSRRRRRTSRSATSASIRWRSTFPCRTRRRTTATSSRWTRTCTPRSLYLTQLRERLGDQAVRNVAISSQQA